MDVTMLLCDAADQVGGKLYVMGGGWTHLQAVDVPTSMALAVVLTVEWDEANKRFGVEAAMRTEDGDIVEINGNPVLQQGDFEVGRPPGLKPGTSLNAPFALSFHGVVLSPGGYVWELSVDGVVKARAPFRVGAYPA